MKTLYLYLISILILCLGCQFSTESAGAPYRAQLVSNEINPTAAIDSVQTQIYNAFVEGMLNESDQPLDRMHTKLKDLYLKSPNKLIRYWQAYLSYYEAIFHLQSGDKKASEKSIDKGIEWLKDMPKKNSEDFALLALMESFSLQFKSSVKLPFISGNVKEHAEQAKELDPKNPRAYYVLGSNDFYTPEKYGGGEKVEEYLTKATSLPEQKHPNAYLPSWGVEEAYEMLIKFYIKGKEWDKAKTTFSEASAKYPDNYRIKELATTLVGK